MAKKQYRREPQVPRSTLSSAAPAAASRGPAAVRNTPAPRTMSEEYSHVKRDLIRIATFGTLIFAAMIALRVVIGG